MHSSNEQAEEMKTVEWSCSETKVASNASFGMEADAEFDLLRDYKDAVGCLIQCESIIETMDEELASKDARIASLEQMLVQMSLELASSKAFEDEHRAKKRILSVYDHPISDDEPRSPEPHAVVKKQHIISRRSSSIDIRAGDSASAPKMRRKTHIAVGRHEKQHRPRRWSRLTSRLAQRWGRGGISIKDDDPISLDDCSATLATMSSCSDTLFDESFSTRSSCLSFDNIAQIFCKNRSKESGVQEEAEKTQEHRRRPPNPARMQLQQSSRSFLEAVVFPRNFDEVLDKGCAELRSLKVSANSLQTVNWE